MEKIEPCCEISEQITAMMQKDVTGDFQQAEKEMKKQTGKPEQEVEKTIDFRGEFVKVLSDYITNGLVQLTIRQISDTKEYRNAFKAEEEPYEISLTKLPPLTLDEFYPYQEIVVKYGAIDIWKKRFDFKVTSKVDIKDARITIRNQKVSCVDFGSLNAQVTIYLMKDAHPVELHSFKDDLTLPTITCE